MWIKKGGTLKCKNSAKGRDDSRNQPNRGGMKAKSVQKHGAGNCPTNERQKKVGWGEKKRKDHGSISCVFR